MFCWDCNFSEFFFSADSFCFLIRISNFLISFFRFNFAEVTIFWTLSSKPSFLTQENPVFYILWSTIRKMAHILLIQVQDLFLGLLIYKMCPV